MLTSRIRSFHGTVHVPVLLAEVISALRDNNCRQILDSTFGGGGYSRAALGIKNTLFSSIELFPNSFVWAIDRDPMAISRAATLPDKFNGRFLAKQASFSEIDTIFGKDLYFDAIMFDLGVSSDQLADGNRGFSFRIPGPLDMRMDPSLEVSAKEILHWSSEQQLKEIIFKYGEEPFAAQIARAIIERRKLSPIHDTTDLASLIETVVPFKPLKKGKKFIHPSTRTFQALRIAVNDEITQIQEGLSKALVRLNPGGILLAVSFHTLEDVAVKEFGKAKIKGIPVLGSVSLF